MTKSPIVTFRIDNGSPAASVVVDVFKDMSVNFNPLITIAHGDSVFITDLDELEFILDAARSAQRKL